VPGDADGVTRTGYTTHDGGRAAKVAFDGATATPLGSADDHAGLIARVLDIARITACNEAVGLMEVALEQTSAYLKSRKQFGVTLNTFQALTFRAADMYVSLELARSLAVWATMVLAGASGEEASVAASRASLGVSRAGRHIGQEAIQLHGGIGMTAEYSIGSYTSRLTALDHLLGDGNHHLALLGAAVGGYDEVDPLP
jgi:alkylation response protein AidB-like acyl-CoA dehydrogenase